MKRGNSLHVFFALAVLIFGFYLIIDGNDNSDIDSYVVYNDDYEVYCLVSYSDSENIGVNDASECCSFIDNRCFSLGGSLSLDYQGGYERYEAEYMCFRGDDKAYISEGVLKACSLLY